MKKRLLLAALAMGLPLVLAAFGAPGCTDIESAPEDAGADGDAHHDSGTSSSSSGTVYDAEVHDAFPDYHDPGCPDAGGPKKHYECDAYHQFNGDCPEGKACYILVKYPSKPCGQETYGSYCAMIGVGMQGDPCADPGDCGAGLECVVSGQGNQCVQLCPLKGADGCPSGLVCEPIDVEGYGGCL